MHRLVVGIALRQHVPLRARVQNPKNRFQNPPRRNGLSARPPFGNVLFRKVIPDTLPLLVRRGCNGFVPLFVIGEFHQKPKRNIILLLSRKFFHF